MTTIDACKFDPCSKADAIQISLEAFDGDETAAEVYINKYALTDDNGFVLEPHPDMHHLRLAKAICDVDGECEDNISTYYNLLRDFSLNPGGSIRFGLGNSKHTSSLSNCYVLGIKKDSIEAIFDAAKQAARTYSYRGGVGIDLSILRPDGARVTNAAKVSTGAHSFMELYSLVTGLIGQNFRRGALMLSLGVWHPDIEKFITAKSDDLRKVQSANTSVLITDEFMHAVSNDTDFTLRFDTPLENIRRTVRARDLWRKIIECAHKTGEPGILFWDTISKYSPSNAYPGRGVVCVNPCGEEPLPNGGSCNLAAITLDRFVDHPFTDYAEFNFKRFENAVYWGVRFLDNVITANIGKNPLAEQDVSMKEERRIGLGPTGLADTLIKLGIRYDSKEAIPTIEGIFSRFRDTAYYSSSKLAAERGSFPVYNYNIHASSPFFNSLPEGVKDTVCGNGLRNMTLLTAAPCGSISCLSQTSSGIEPVFAFQHKRRLEQAGSGDERTKIVITKVARDYLKSNGYTQDQIDGLDDMRNLFDERVFVEAHEIDFVVRTHIQGVVQQYIDASISSTINLSSDATVDQVARVYEMLWKNGCKGGTVYRAGSRNDILKKVKKVEEKFEEVVVGEEPHIAIDMDRALPEKRPYIIPAYIAQVPLVGGDQKVYIVIGYTGKRLYEVFTIVGYSGEDSHGWAEGLGRLLSNSLQNGIDPETLTRSIRRIRSGGITQFRLGENQERPYTAGSIPSIVAAVIEHLTGDDGTLELRKMRADVDEAKVFAICPYCHERAVEIKKGGECMHCLGCGREVCE